MKQMMVFLLLGGSAHAISLATVIAKGIPVVASTSNLNYQEVYKEYQQVFKVTAPPDKASVGKMCRETMLSILKSPASTKFVKDAGVEYWSKSGTYLAGGALDSQNSFGALLRKNYICTAIFIGDKKGGKFYVHGDLLGD